ncbi:MAG TPA: N-acetyltransferase [Tepidisphaeraceae bacterium]|nr:N-acetyltransferase [Tepidisphaeraceae bacterium]
MSLPVLKGAAAVGRDDLLRFFHKIQLEYRRHLGEETQLDCGTAIVNAELKSVSDANGVMDAALPPDTAAAAALDSVTAHFAQSSSLCQRWVLNPSAPLEQTQPLVEELTRRGHARQTMDILHLPRLPQSPVREVGGLRIVPARASYRHVRELAEEAGQSADAALLHLDDPRFEAMLALKEGQAVAIAGVLGSGENAGVQQLFVSERFRRQGIGRTMMSRVLEICVRSLYRHILLSVEPQNTAAQGLFRGLGFEKVGEWVEFVSS